MRERLFDTEERRSCGEEEDIPIRENKKYLYKRRRQISIDEDSIVWEQKEEKSQNKLTFFQYKENVL